MDAADAAGTAPPRRSLRILFSMRNFWYVKLFDSAIRELAARGHHVHILAERGAHNERSRDWNAAAAALASECPTVTFAWAPHQVEDDWVDLRMMIRLALDHLRFLEPEYIEAPMLGIRARRRTPRGFVRLVDLPGLRSRPGRRLIAAALRAVESAIPTGAALAERIESHAADVILVTPMLTLGSEQVDVLRTARRRGVPVVLSVGSWDHLSSKALIRQVPDRVFVWNETQKREATSLHRIPRERVVVTGAQCFDQWFDRQPTLDRDAFCRKVGLDPARPYVLYVCSALFEGSPNEAEFVARWVSALRSSPDARLREAGILVRPHPKRGFEWNDVTLDGLEHVSRWPREATAPFDAESKSDYFDSLFHSAAITGLNSSALIEGGIVGRPIHTILLPEFHDNQEGTLHFKYLLDGGLLRSARDVPGHVQQLAESLAQSDPAVHHNRAFIEQFVRPDGLDRAATPRFADAVEHTAGLASRPQPDPIWVPALKAVLAPLARRTRGTFAHQVGRQRRVAAKARARIDRIAALNEQRAREKAQLLAERRARHDAAARQSEAARQQARDAKLRTKEDARLAKRQAKEARLAEARRRKRLSVFNQRVAAYVRRLMRPFSASR
jgi:hypothetical protein